MLNLDTPLDETDFLHINPKIKLGLEKLKIKTVKDILHHFPNRYEDRSKFETFPQYPTKKPVCLHIEIIDTKIIFGRGRGRKYFEAIAKPVKYENTISPTITLRWFNVSYIQKIISPCIKLIIYGEVKSYRNKLIIDHPEFEIVDLEIKNSDAHMDKIIPIYRASKGISQKVIRTLVYNILKNISDSDFPDYIPQEYNPININKFLAIKEIHYPSSFQMIKLSRKYLALEEFTIHQVNLISRKEAYRRKKGKSRKSKGELLKKFLKGLPFKPTNSQKKVIKEIKEDIYSNLSMIRLLQGDVGAGKTLVAAAAILMTIESGDDATLMAPTQILAEQHYLNFKKWFSPLNIDVKLITGSKKKGESLPLFSKGSPSLTVGTHALVHNKEGFDNTLGLVVIDEQHKFGADQRQKLINQGSSPDILIMSATPIPRTLALSFYGDLDISVLDELPPGRQKIVTGIRLTTQTNDAIKFIQSNIDTGRQAYIVYPLIEKSKNLLAKSAIDEFKEWKVRMPKCKFEILHGKMSSEQKDNIMKDFKEKKFDILISTTVIEVGVDVPNANIMIIYNADRFGLAQLHQLRGRIGRGDHKSFCVLMIDPKAKDSAERLRILENTSDGFLISQEDLKQRGPGEILGIQQSGMSDIKFIEYIMNKSLVEEAKEISEKIIFKSKLKT